MENDTKKIKRYIFLTVILAIVIVGIIIVLVTNKNNKEQKAETPDTAHKIMHVYMPDVVGSMEESAHNKLSDIGFYNIRIEYEKTGMSEIGRVNRQSIPPNTTVGTDFEIILYIEQ